MRLTKGFGNEMIAAEWLGQDIQDLKERGDETSILVRWMSRAASRNRIRWVGKCISASRQVLSKYITSKLTGSGRPKEAEGGGRRRKEAEGVCDA